MAKRVLKSVQECEDLAYGLAFLGTGGGGGTPQLAVDFLSRELEAGREIALLDIADLPGEAWTVTVAGMGGRAAAEGPSKEELAKLGLTKEKYVGLDSLTAAVQELVKYAGVKIEAIVPGELGCFNTPGPIIVGLRLGLPSVDGDYAGRAIPEVEQMIPEVYGLPMYPMVFVDHWGDVCILKESCSSAMADRIGRMLCGAAFGGVGVAWYLMKAKEVQKVLAHNSLTRALEIGRARREALEKGANPAQAIVESAGGWLLFKGEVAEEEVEDRGQAYMFGYGIHHLQGIEEYEGEKFDIWYKNENHVSWKNGEPYVTSPDLISIVELETGEAKGNYYVSAGQRVAVIGTKAHPAHRTKRGVEVLGPRHFGFDIEYVPIEDRVKG